MLKYLDDAKVRGVFTTIISGGSSSALHFASMGLGMSPILSTILTFYIFGSIIAYSLDILFAKQEFLIKTAQDVKGKLIYMPYSQMKFRFIWLFKSFFSMTFYKFLVTMVIDTLMGIAILSSILRVLYSSNIEFMFMETIIAGFVALGTFILYNNVLRFDWAYKEQVNPVIDILVLMWASLIILIFSLTYRGDKKNENKNENENENENENAIAKPVRMTWLWKE